MRKFILSILALILFVGFSEARGRGRSCGSVCYPQYTYSSYQPVYQQAYYPGQWIWVPGLGWGQVVGSQTVQEKSATPASQTPVVKTKPKMPELEKKVAPLPKLD